MLKYRDLTPEQKDKICNGCGGKGGFINPPEFLFHASCNKHDSLYSIGGSEEDREEADKTFYKLMKLDISKEPNRFKRYYYSAWAYTYYKAVRKFGYEFFSYGPKHTLEELCSK